MIQLSDWELRFWQDAFLVALKSTLHVHAETVADNSVQALRERCKELLAKRDADNAERKAQLEQFLGLNGPEPQKGVGEA